MSRSESGGDAAGAADGLSSSKLQAFPRFKPGPRDSSREAPQIQMKGNPKTQRRIESVHKMCLQIVLNVLFTSMERTKCRVKKEQSQRTIV